VSEKTALLVLNFGGPQHQGEVEGFLFELFRDKDVIPLPGGSYLQEVFADVVSGRRAPRIREQYAQIGGGSPLSAMTYQQVDALVEALKQRGHEPEVHVGMRYTKPSIATALKAIKAGGATRLVCLALYPHFSFATTGSSYNEVARAMKRLGMEHLPTTFIPAWYDHPEYIGAVVERVWAALEGAPEGTHLLFSAHGLPVSFIKRGDPYQQHVQQTVRDVVKAAGWTGPYSLAFQSKVGPSRWLSPATDDELKRLGAAKTPAVVVVPVSFVGDHIETLFELDIEYRHVAHEAGLHDYRRAGALDVHPRFIGALADVTARALGEPKGRACVRCLLPREESHLGKPRCPDCAFKQPDFMR
jgi:ferrochelatase